MTKFRIAAGLVMAFVASSAFAQAGSQLPSAGAASDLFVVVLNQTTNASEVVDLGVLPTTLTSGDHWTIDPSLVGTGTVVFQLVAGDWSQLTGSNGYATDILYSTTANPAFGFVGSSALAAVSSFDSYIGNYGAAFTANASNGGLQTLNLAGSAANRWNGTGLPGTSLTIGGFNGAGAINNAASPLALYSYTVTTDPNNAAATAVKLGTFTLSGTTLTFTGLSSVPVPAALWLLASGILGLGAAGRRRVAV